MHDTQDQFLARLKKAKELVEPLREKFPKDELLFQIESGLNILIKELCKIWPPTEMHKQLAKQIGPDNYRDFPGEWLALENALADLAHFIKRAR